MRAPRHDHERREQPVVIDRLLALRSALLESATPGLDAARRLAALADDAIAALAEDTTAAPPAPWTVIALGGYGSGRMLPGSDFDLLIVCDAPAARVKPFAETVFYPLWDSGLPVGHQVRSRKEHHRACAGDLTTLTASLTGRVVAGDAALGERLLADVAAKARRDRRRLLAELAARSRPGTPYLLEPDLKEGAGGQRDLDELAWTAAVLTGAVAHDPSPLVPLGVLPPEELGRLDAAAETLTAARWMVHRSQGRPRETLTLEAAEDLPLAAEALNSALADIANLLTRVRRRVAGMPDPLPPSTPAELFAALGEGEAALPRLEEAAWAGELEPLVPGIAELMPARRPGLLHLYTVGAHSLAAAALVADAPSKDRFAAETLAQIGDRRPLLAAALTHDFGKRGGGPGHAERGVEPARQIAGLLGIPEAADDVALLVREHLLIAETAARADVADEDTVLRAAARIKRRELVAPLYVLTVTDTLATSPTMWTPWRAAISREVTVRLDAALSPDIEGAGIAHSAEKTRAEALALLGDADERQRAFVEAAPMRYLATTPPGIVAIHAELAAPLVGSHDAGAAGVSVGMGPLPGTWRVTIATLDRHGLFAQLAGVFALAGLSILGADAMPGPAGTAIDVFTVESATLAAVDTATWSAFERTLRASLGGKLELEVRLAERRRHYPPRRAGVPARVRTDVAGDFTTGFFVQAPDRVGLLHDLALVLAAAGMDIRSATVLTHDGIASDTFRVSDASGVPPRDPVQLASIAVLLTAAARGTH